MSNVSQFFQSNCSSGGDSIGSIVEFDCTDPVVVQGSKNYARVSGAIVDKNLFDPGTDFSNTFNSINGYVKDPSVLLERIDLEKTKAGYSKNVQNPGSSQVRSKGWYINDMYYLYSGATQTITRSSDLVYWEPNQLVDIFDLDYDGTKFYALKYVSSEQIVYQEYDDIYGQPTLSVILTLNTDIPHGFKVVNRIPYLFTTSGNLYKIAKGTGATTLVLATSLTADAGSEFGMAYAPDGAGKYFMFFNTNYRSTTASSVYYSSNGDSWTSLAMQASDYLTNIRYLPVISKVVATMTANESFTANSTHGIAIFTLDAIPAITRYKYASDPKGIVSDIFHDGSRFVVSAGPNNAGLNRVQALYLNGSVLNSAPSTLGANKTEAVSSGLSSNPGSNILLVNGKYFSDGTLFSSSNPNKAAQLWMKTDKITTGSFSDLTATNFISQITTSIASLEVAGVSGLMINFATVDSSAGALLSVFVELSGTNDFKTTGRVKFISLIRSNYLISTYLWNNGRRIISVSNGKDKLVVAPGNGNGSTTRLAYWNGTSMAMSSSNIGALTGTAYSLVCWNGSFYLVTFNTASSYYTSITYSDNGGQTWTQLYSVTVPASSTGYYFVAITKNAIVFLRCIVTSSNYSYVAIMRLKNGTWMNSTLGNLLASTSSYPGQIFSWPNSDFFYSSKQGKLFKIKEDGSFSYQTLPVGDINPGINPYNMSPGYISLASNKKCFLTSYGANFYSIDFTNIDSPVLITEKSTLGVNTESLQAEIVSDKLSSTDSDTYKSPVITDEQNKSISCVGLVYAKYDTSKVNVETHRVYKNSSTDASDKFRYIRIK